MIYDLPTSFEIGGKEYEIRSDYRAALDICVALSDPELDDSEKALVALTILYPDFDDMPPSDYKEALDKCLWFINGGEEDDGKKAPKLMDWEQDFKLLVAPVNRVLGKEIRSLEYLHWWTWVSAYMEIGGDCTFAQIVSIRDKQARHKQLDKAEKEWLKRNRDLVEFKQKYTQAEDDLLKQWT